MVGNHGGVRSQYIYTYTIYSVHIFIYVLIIYYTIWIFPVVMDEFLSDVPGSGAAPGGVAPPGLRLARLADAETGKVAAKLSPEPGPWRFMVQITWEWFYSLHLTTSLFQGKYHEFNEFDHPHWYGSVSKPCTPVVHIKIAGIYGCSSP